MEIKARNKLQKQEFIRKTLPENIKVILLHKSKKISKRFKFESKQYFYHQSNLLYFGKGPNQTCEEDYIGETDPIIDFNKCDKSSDIIKHSCQGSIIKLQK